MLGNALTSQQPILDKNVNFIQGMSTFRNHEHQVAIPKRVGTVQHAFHSMHVRQVAENE